MQWGKWIIIASMRHQGVVIAGNNMSLILPGEPLTSPFYLQIIDKLFNFNKF
jgi:hypothetical protein